ncbi:hypothetical protein IT400_01980 [Candidatus Nomurabacteria bacterium]|nr:hypothetical protein [Candidatus Nomurabacteria bacterium]
MKTKTTVADKQLDRLSKFAKIKKVAKNELKVIIKSLNELIKKRRMYSTSDYDEKISMFWRTYHLANDLINRAEKNIHQAEENLDYIYGPENFMKKMRALSQK